MFREYSYNKQLGKNKEIKFNMFTWKYEYLKKMETHVGKERSVQG